MHHSNENTTTETIKSEQYHTRRERIDRLDMLKSNMDTLITDLTLKVVSLICDAKMKHNEYKNDYDDLVKKAFGDLHMKYLRRRQIDKKEILCTMCEKEIKSVLFSSDNEEDKWSVNESNFLTKIKGHEPICICIEDLESRTIGGLYYFDDKQYSLNLDRKKIFFIDYETSQCCYLELKPGYEHIYIGKEDEEVLFALGWKEIDGKKEFNDLCVYKEGNGKKSYWKLNAYDYPDQSEKYFYYFGGIGEEKTIEIKRIVVYELRKENISSLKAHKIACSKEFPNFHNEE